MEEFVAAFLSAHFHSCHTDPLGLTILSLCCPPIDDIRLCFLNSSKTETAKCQYLLLLIDREMQQILVGIDALVYTDSTEHTRLFIRYVDTTGYFQPRREQSKVTKLFVEAFIRFINADNLNLTSIAKPSYLFPLSHKNPLKREISGQKLSAWWADILAKVYQNVDSFSRNSTAAKMVEIPLFPDDLKSCHLKNVYQAKEPSNSKFLTSLEASYDFSYNCATIFHCSVLRQDAVQLSENETCPSSMSTQPRITTNCTIQEFKAIHEILANGSFDDAEKALLVTAKILKKFPKEFNFLLKSNGIPRLDTSKDSSAAPSVQNIQAFVKRKK